MAVLDRRHVRDAGTQRQDPPLVLVVECDVARHLGTWPDQAHLAHQHVHELRAFVELVAAQEVAEEAPPPTGADAARWVVLAAVPSALLIAVTSHISTDIAAAPFMWVIPLALYLALLALALTPVLPQGLPVLAAAAVAVAAAWPEPRSATSGATIRPKP